MGIQYDHVQYLNSVELLLGQSTADIEIASPCTNEEVYRALVDAGFSANIDSLELDAHFWGSSSVVQDVTWKFQIRSIGESTWVDLNSETESWGGLAEFKYRAFLASGDLGASTTLPAEVRMIATASSGATLTIELGNATPAIRAVGDSVS